MYITGGSNKIQGIKKPQGCNFLQNNTGLVLINAQAFFYTENATSGVTAPVPEILRRTTSLAPTSARPSGERTRKLREKIVTNRPKRWKAKRKKGTVDLANYYEDGVIMTSIVVAKSPLEKT